MGAAGSFGGDNHKKKVETITKKKKWVPRDLSVETITRKCVCWCI